MKNNNLEIAKEATRIYFDYNISAKEAIEKAKENGNAARTTKHEWQK